MTLARDSGGEGVGRGSVGFETGRTVRPHVECWFGRGRVVPSLHYKSNIMFFFIFISLRFYLYRSPLIFLLSIFLLTLVSFFFRCKGKVYGLTTKAVSTFVKLYTLSSIQNGSLTLLCSSCCLYKQKNNKWKKYFISKEN